MRLSTLFSNGMVLQRGQKNLLWGYTKEGVTVKGSFGGKGFTVASGKKGYFEVVLPETAVGGPYELYVSDGEEICIRDVLVGDVFLLGGQSNMELPLKRTLDLFRKELDELGEPEIRMFEVPKEYLFGTVREDLDHGKWIRAVGEDRLNFSAVGYFLAKIIRKQKHVPIGLLQTAVGGTPVQAWCSEGTLQEMELSIEEIMQCKDADYVRKTIEKEFLVEQNWRRKAWQAISCVNEWTGEMVIPGIWNQKPLLDFHGSLLLEKKVEVSKSQSRCRSYLRLGAIVDADRVFVNGVMVGETEYKYPPRCYELPLGLLHIGVNLIRIEMCVFREKGGFIPDKSYEIVFEDEVKSAIKLEGTWKYAIGKELPYLPEMTFFQSKPTGLYNGMIYPVRKWNICCFLFYQGESNTDDPEGYSRVFEAMIGDWRTLWKRRNLPFLYVQLAGFADAEKVCKGTKWAALREEQRKVLKVWNTAMVVAFDVGEYNDLHPQDKKTIGYRLSLAVRKLVYGENLMYSGPIYDKMGREGERVRISFIHIKGGLRIGNESEGKEPETVLKGFEVCHDDGIFVPAFAKIEYGSVLVWNEEVGDIRRVRYAWLDNPEEANLYNAENLPASPFITE